MCLESWVRAPIGMDAEHRLTLAGSRSVLATVPTLTAGTRLLDLARLLRDDHRVHVVFTIPDTIESWHGTAEFLRACGALVIPWQQAVQHRFDLILAASYTGLERVRGHVLVVPHGASSLMSRKYSRSAGPSAMPHVGLARETLTHRGRLLASVIAVTHHDELNHLRTSCPEALPNAVVAGDICYDRLLASRSSRDRYRQAVGVREDQCLVTVSSTWSSESVFGRHPDLCRRLLDVLPGKDYRVALILHPSIWAVYGRWQIRAWLAGCVRDGLLVVPPEEGWRAMLVASDLVIGDHGSTTQYAAALGTPLALATFPVHAVRAGSIADAVARAAPMLDLDRPLRAQVSEAARRRPGFDGPAVAPLVTSRPGGAAAVLRRAMYDLLRLPEPDTAPTADPVPAPRVLWSDLVEATPT